MSRRYILVTITLKGERRMDEIKSIVRYRIGEYGKVIVKLAKVVDSRGITRNRLATLTGVQYSIIDRYYKGKRIEMVDLDFLAKVCYVLDCRIDDLLEYRKPEETGEVPE